MANKKIFVRMLRTQTGSFGTRHAGVIYQVEDKTADSFAGYVKKGFAEEISAKDLAKIVKDGAQVEAATESEDDGSEDGDADSDEGGES